MQKPENLTDKEFAFVENYLATGKVSDSAIKAGYSEKTAGPQGSRLLKQPKIIDYITKRQRGLDDGLIAGTDEILKYLTRVMRNEEKDLCDRDVPIQERSRAAVELLKRLHDNTQDTSSVIIVNDIPRPKNT